MKTIITIVILGAIGVVGYIFGYPMYELYTLNGESVNTENLPSRIELDTDIQFEKLGSFLNDKGFISNGDDLDRLIELKEGESSLIGLEYLIVEKENWSTLGGVYNNVKYQMKHQKKVAFAEFNNAHSIEDIAGKLSRNINLDSLELLSFLTNPELISKLGFEEATYRAFFLPIKVEVYVDITAEELLEKLKSYYKSFWNEERKQKAANLGLSQSEITTLASIVYEEQKTKFDEQAKIAGLYINRLNKKMKLQSDPTVKYAIGKPGLRRVLYEHLEYDSPYNTYVYVGLPPGPICFPPTQTIDAVLNYETHDYIYMCAKPEYSGYHNFSKTLKQHNTYASKYRKWLDKEGIR